METTSDSLVLKQTESTSTLATKVHVCLDTTTTWEPVRTAGMVRNLVHIITPTIDTAIIGAGKFQTTEDRKNKVSLDRSSTSDRFAWLLTLLHSGREKDVKGNYKCDVDRHC